MNNQKIKQSGFIVLTGLLLLVLGAALWFGTVSNMRSESIKTGMQNEHVLELKRIKERMLAYAVMQPEIFATNSGSTVRRNQVDIPGPGYFPCPDTNGDGNSNAPCGAGVAFVMGLIPERNSTSNYTFLDSNQDIGKYWYAVDSRFLTQNSDYIYAGEQKRFVPLNRASPALASLTLDGRADIVMVLMYAGDTLKTQQPSQPSVANVANFLEQDNSNGDASFISVFDDPAPVANNPRFNDYVIPITRTEWNAAVLSRVSQDEMTGTTAGTAPDNVPDLCNIVTPADLHWFNDCFYTAASPGNPLPFACTLDAGAAGDNLYGQGWRSELGCPP
ncbi:hypothetical protein [Thiomicrorhabdus sp.]|uniref:hypothetical protein n=1 Tax=Thiomicrorhabdus sp. TaxID=2039724 RepID=UPI002AA74D09|nr:hypothetical protein [Thiomicrorhabdus sp.]